MHAENGFFVRDSDDQGHTTSVADSENFILRNWVDDVTHRIVSNPCYSALMGFYTSNILVSIIGHLDNVNHTIIKTN